MSDRVKLVREIAALYQTALCAKRRPMGRKTRTLSPTIRTEHPMVPNCVRGNHRRDQVERNLFVQQFLPV